MADREFAVIPIESAPALLRLYAVLIVTKELLRYSLAVFFLIEFLMSSIDDFKKIDV